MKPFRKHSPLRLAQRKRCFSTSDYDRRSCYCWEYSRGGNYCAVGFRTVDGIPQEPCPKPLTVADEITVKEYHRTLLKRGLTQWPKISA